MKRLIRKILREEIDKSDRHYRMLDKISEHVQLPYFESMEGLTIDDRDDQLYIMKKILGNITIDRPNWHWDPLNTSPSIYDDGGNKLYYEEYSNGDWKKWEYDDNGNLIYFKRSNGYWEKRENDDKGNIIYYEDSSGYWVKREYNDKGNVIYFEESDGYIDDRR